MQAAVDLILAALGYTKYLLCHTQGVWAALFKLFSFTPFC
jgi:hypothetical protein